MRESETVRRTSARRLSAPRAKKKKRARARDPAGFLTAVRRPPLPKDEQFEKRRFGSKNATTTRVTRRACVAYATLTRRVRGPRRSRTHPSRTLARSDELLPGLVEANPAHLVVCDARRGGGCGVSGAGRDAARRAFLTPPESCAFSLEKGPPRGRRARPRRRPRVRSGSRERTHRCRDPAPRTWSASDPCWGRRASSRPSRSRAGAARRQPVAANDGGDFRGTRSRGATRRERARRIRGDDARGGARGGARGSRATSACGVRARSVRGGAPQCARAGGDVGEKVLIRAIFARRARVARRQESRRSSRTRRMGI